LDVLITLFKNYSNHNKRATRFCDFTVPPFGVLGDSKVLAVQDTGLCNPRGGRNSPGRVK
jgi:hypothetical protein